MPRAAALAALVVLLAGCAPDPVPLPPPLTTAEAEQFFAERDDRLWLLLGDRGPMPEVEPVELVSASTEGDPLQDCMDRAVGIAGWGIGYSGVEGPDGTPLGAAVNRAVFVCLLQYPYDLSDPEAVGVFSDQQRAWVWDYQRRRLVPCLQRLGYDVDNRDWGYTTGDRWDPYDELRPRPATERDWDRIIAECPPAPLAVNTVPGL